MSTKHTPGPWHCGWGDGLTGPTTPAIDGPTVAGDRWDYTPVRKGTETLAICPNQVDFGRTPVEGSSEANARLIAASPELLEALEEMVRWYAKRETASMCVSGGEGLLPIEVQDEEVQQAMRAIAKATEAT